MTKRVACELECSYRDLDNPKAQPSRSVAIKDISLGGMKIRTNKFIPVNHRMMVAFNLPKRSTIETKAAPVWVAEIPNIDCFDLGVRFLEMSHEAKKALQSYL